MTNRRKAYTDELRRRAARIEAFADEYAGPAELREAHAQGERGIAQSLRDRADELDKEN
jgi:hypothetical protein